MHTKKLILNFFYFMNIHNFVRYVPISTGYRDISDKIMYVHEIKEIKYQKAFFMAKQQSPINLQLLISPESIDYWNRCAKMGPIPLGL